MRALAFSLLLGASSALSPFQHVMKASKQEPNVQDSQLYNFQDSFKALTGQVRATWDEVSSLFPEAMKQANTLPPPKGHRRRPDSYWDHITRGAEIQNSWVVIQGEDRSGDVEEHLNAYNLRSKKNNPSVLGVDPGVTQYSGYLDDEENDKHLFYWFFESRNDPKNDPVVLWLNGGPGCSSLTGLFAELGPSSIDENIHVAFNPYSWNSNASVIFLDQPVNTGFSYSGRSVSNTVAASKDIYALLTLFFQQFPQYSHQDFHIAGESYAGHYIPVFTAEILRHQDRNINLKSVLMGNGLTDGMTQYAYYRPMACGDGGWPAILDQGTCRGMDNALSRCQSLIKGCYQSESVWTCVPASIYCNNVMMGPYQRTGQNVYDIREKCKDPENLCYPELGLIAQYLNRDEVKEAVGAEVAGFSACNFDVNRNFLLNGDWMKPYHRLVPSILEQIPVLVYAGDADFICNWLGNYAWTEALDWPGKAAYNQVDMTPLRVGGEGEKYGEVKSSGNLTFMRIHAAGHMVPFNQPEGGLDFFNRWLHGEWLAGRR